MPFFHSLFRGGFQSNGWQLSPSSTIFTPPKAMCKCGCCLPGVEAACIGCSSAGKQHWPQVPVGAYQPSTATPKTEGLHVFTQQMHQVWAVVLKVAVGVGESSNCKRPPPFSSLPLYSLLPLSSLGILMTHRPSHTAPLLGAGLWQHPHPVPDLRQGWP